MRIHSLLCAVFALCLPLHPASGADTGNLKDSNRLLRQAGISAPGIRVVGDKIFSTVARNADSGFKADAAASSEAARNLLNFCLKKAELSPLSKTAMNALSGRLHLDGTLMVHGAPEASAMFTTFAADKADFDRQCRRILERTKTGSYIRQALADPASAAPVLKAAGFSEGALLAEFLALETNRCNVAFISANPAAGKSACTKAPLVVGPFLDVLRGISAEAAVKTARSKGAAALNLQFQTPVLKQAALCQGLVRLDPLFKTHRPRYADTVKAFFREGRELQFVTALLEADAEAAPADPETWEYLEAAWRAAGETDKAHLACRIWYLTSNGSLSALKGLLRYQQGSVADKELISILN